MSAAIAYFVSPHGFGHAARASAVMSALRRRRPEIGLHVFTTVPRWFFDDSIGGDLSYHPLRTDVGFVQRSPFVENLPATLAALEEFWSGLEPIAADLAATLGRLEVERVVCDISPLGLLAAEKAGLPSVLVENFTWDWIYRGYLDAEPRLAEYVGRNEELVGRAGRRVQVEPTCGPVEGSLRVGPVSRAVRSPRRAIRRAVGLEEGDSRPLILLTMGGMGWSWRAELGSANDAFFVTLGGIDSLRREDSLLALPDRSPIYPPDLTAAADLVVAKLGYSTVAECSRAGVRLTFLERPSFPESDVLAAFCSERLGAVALDSRALTSGEWRADLPNLLARPAPRPVSANGADEVARFLTDA